MKTLVYNEYEYINFLRKYNLSLRFISPFFASCLIENELGIDVKVKLVESPFRGEEYEITFASDEEYSMFLLRFAE